VTSVTLGTQANAEDRAAGRIVLDQETAAVGLDDRMADGQPHAQPVNLGREERLEDPAEIGVRDPLARVVHAKLDVWRGHDCGPHDICKPFSPREVVARAKAVLRHRATIDGADLNLTVVEFQLLKVLADHPGRIYTREQLMDAMYRDERVVSDRTVDSHIKKIRRKISAVLPDREVVHSVYGLGYKYEW